MTEDAQTEEPLPEESPEAGSPGGWRPDPNHVTVAIPVLVFATGLAFLLTTGQIWEDTFITVRHSVNLAEGRGLTYEPPDRVHGFTSPLGVLLPALGYWLTNSETGMLWFLRLAGLFALVGAAALLIRSLRRMAPNDEGDPTGALWWPVLLFPGLLLAFESKGIAFATNGMETGLYLLFLAGALHTLACGLTDHPWRMGAWWAGMMWTRPDACIPIALLGAAALLFGPASRKETLGALLRAAGLCTLLYLPWFAGAWIYYGSPVPHTVIAKGASGAGVGAAIGRLVRLPAYTLWLFLPPYAEFGGWSHFGALSVILAVPGLLYWVLPSGNRLARQASFIAFGGITYLATIPFAFPWYYPPFLLLTLPALSALCRRADRRVRDAGRRLAEGVVLLLLLGMSWLYLDYADLAEASFRINDWGNRRRIGLWLEETSAPTDRVFLECTGYIGYFSERATLDYPGLTSPDVVRVRRILDVDDMAHVAMVLKPEWMVLRPGEILQFEEAEAGWLQRHYERAAVFDVRARLQAEVPDHPMALFDSLFIVFEKRGATE